MKKIFTLIAALTLSVGLWAVNNVPYIDANGQLQYANDATGIISSTNLTDTLKAGWYMVMPTGNEKQTGTLVCQGEVHLILIDGAKLTATGADGKPGIEVSGEGNSLTIYGNTNQSGQLIANGGANAAGIGGGNKANGSNITIYGGMITANGGENASAIGSGNGGDAASNIFVATSLVVKAGSSTNPTDKIAKTRTATTDIAADLAGQRYATIENTVHKVKASDGAEVLKSTIAEAAAGDIVLVQEGKFIGNFTMKEGVQVIGGWDETFTSKKDYATILDANADGRVLNQPAAFSTLTVWSNFTIQNGKLTTALSDQGAAGVFLNVKGRVQDCLIQNNVVDVPSGNAMGGGVSCNSGTADPDTVAYNCVIKNNTATHGGGVRVNGKGVVIYKCVIEGNQTTNNAGGGAQLHNGSHLVNCIVRNNKANGDTGGVCLSGGNISTVINCLIVGNEATGQVGGLCMDGNLANIINCTIVGNKQNKVGATASLSGVKVNNNKSANGSFFVNNIVWGNITADTLATQGVYYLTKYDKAQGQRSYNAIIGQKGDDDATETTSLILTKENPGFADPENGDFTLVAGSKLIDFGSDVANTLPIDLAGNKRIQGKSIDLGAYEAVPATAVANPTITADTVATVYWKPITATLACATEGASIYYTTDGSEPTASATKYDAPFSVTATTTVKAIAIKSGLDNSEVVSKTFTFGTFFTSLEELVANQPAKEDVAYVQVTITDAVIDSLYVTSKGYTNGIFVTAANTVVELYTNDVPATWKVGGKVSGTIKAEWLLYKGVAKLQKWDGAWEAFTYTAPAPAPTVDETGITVNGRKYGFPVRLVKEVK